MRKYFVRVPKWSRFIYPKAIWCDHKIGGVIWTIDDGPHPKSTKVWLDFLQDRDLKAVFFLSGANCEQYPNLLDDIKLAGHKVGSHGFDHLDGWKTPAHKYIDNAKRGMAVIKSDLYRPPYGRMTRSQYLSVSKISKIMMWSVMPGDFDTSVSEEVILMRSRSIHSGDIVVLHDNPESLKKGFVVINSVVSSLRASK